MICFRRAVAVVGLSAAAAGLVGCGGGGSTTPTTLGPNSDVIKNIAFIPSTMSVKVGDTVTWVWKDGSIPHNVNGKATLPDLYSGNPKTAGTYQYTFRQAGTFHVTCDVHTSMHLTVNVS